MIPPTEWSKVLSRSASCSGVVEWLAATSVAGDLATDWSSGGDGVEAYLVIDLGRTPTPTGPSPWATPMSVSPGRSCVSTSTRRAVGTPEPGRSRFSKVRDAASAGDGRRLHHPSQVENEGCCQGET